MGQRCPTIAPVLDEPGAVLQPEWERLPRHVIEDCYLGRHAWIADKDLGIPVHHPFPPA